MSFTEGHLIIRFSKGKTANQQLKEFANRDWSRRWLITFGKLKNSVLLLVVDVAQLDHAVIVQWRRAVAVSQHAERPAVFVKKLILT